MSNKLSARLDKLATKAENAANATKSSHKSNMDTRLDAAVRTVEGVDIKAELDADALAIWLPVAKAMANDADVRNAVISAMASASGAEVYWVASLFRGIVAAGNPVHRDAFKVTFNAKSEPKVKFLEGSRTIPANMLSRAAYVEGIAKLAKHATEDSMLALFQTCLANLVRAGKLKV